MREIALSQERPAKKYLVCVALVGKTRWIGANNSKSHPNFVRESEKGDLSSIHAEIDAIVKVPRDARKKIKLFVFRFLKDGSVSMAKPCDECVKMLKREGVKMRNIWFSNWDGKMERME